MSTFRPAIACLLATVMLTGAVAAPAAIARPTAEERYLSSYGEPPALDALAQEQYYSSYGTPEPQDSTSDGTAWLPIVLPAAAIVLVGAVLVVGRARHRARAGRVTARVAA